MVKSVCTNVHIIKGKNWFVSSAFSFYFNGFYMVSFWIKVLVILLCSICLMLLPTIIAVAIAVQYYEGKWVRITKPGKSIFICVFAETTLFSSLPTQPWDNLGPPWRNHQLPIYFCYCCQILIDDESKTKYTYKMLSKDHLLVPFWCFFFSQESLECKEGKPN